MNAYSRGAAVLSSLALAGTAVLAYASLIERNRYTVRQALVPILAEGEAPIRILHLSDLHLAPWQHDKISWVRALARLRPDLVLTTGDNLGHRDAVPAVLRALEPLAGIPGAFVYGSNDYYGPSPKNPFNYVLPGRGPRAESELLDTPALTAGLERFGWHDLNNAAALLNVHGRTLEVLGLDDPHIDRDEPEVLPQSLEQLREAQDEPPLATIGLSHAPYQRALNSLITNGAQLLLAGHTHGGQVRVPGLKAALATNCDIPPEQARGLSRWHHAGRAAWLHVSAGVGTSIYAPVRFACPPEVTLITLVPRR